MAVTGTSYMNSLPLQRQPSRLTATSPSIGIAGLPEPQNMHAVICARFAASCIQYTRDVTSSLAGTLGADTADLQLRIGLHSGPVT